MFCKKCGREINEKAMYCPYCGEETVNKYWSLSNHTDVAQSLKKSIVCEKCGAPTPEDSVFCVNCGEKIIIKHKCTNCGAELLEEAEYCMYCGQKIEKQDNLHDSSVENNNAVMVAEKSVKDKYKPKESYTDSIKSNNINILDVVQNNREYFRREFDSIESGNKSKFNWAAFLFNFSYCYYRKNTRMAEEYYYKFYTIFIVGLIVLAIVSCNLSDMDSITLFLIILMLFIGLIGIVQFILAIRCGMNFNKNYYEHCKSLINNDNNAKDHAGTSIGKFIASMIIIAVLVGIPSGVIGMGLTYSILDSITVNDYYGNYDYYDDDGYVYYTD